MLVYRVLCEWELSFVWGESSGVQLLDHTLVACLGLFVFELQSGCTILYSHQWCLSDPDSPHLHQHSLESPFMVASLISGWQYLFVVLLCISLTVNDVEHLFMYIFFYLYIFFGGMSFHVFFLCSNWRVCSFYCWILSVHKIFYLPF